MHESQTVFDFKKICKKNVRIGMWERRVRRIQCMR